EPVRMVGELLVGVVADRVALPGIGLIDLDRLVDLVEPARPAWRDYEMRHHAPRAGLLVDLLAGLEHLLLRDEPILGNLRGRVRQQRHLGVAVHVNFFDVVGVFQIVDRLFLVAELLVPAGFSDRLAGLDKPISRVSSRRKCVWPSMMNCLDKAPARSAAKSGVAASASLTSNRRPKTSFMTKNEAAMPEAV